jgi:hypothetical protein
VVELWPRRLMVKGSSPATAVGAGREGRVKNSKIVIQHWPTDGPRGLKDTVFVIVDGGWWDR